MTIHPLFKLQISSIVHDVLRDRHEYTKYEVARFLVKSGFEMKSFYRSGIWEDWLENEVFVPNGTKFKFDVKALDDFVYKIFDNDPMIIAIKKIERKFDHLHKW